MIMAVMMVVRAHRADLAERFVETNLTCVEHERRFTRLPPCDNISFVYEGAELCARIPPKLGIVIDRFSPPVPYRACRFAGDERLRRWPQLRETRAASRFQLHRNSAGDDRSDSRSARRRGATFRFRL